LFYFLLSEIGLGKCLSGSIFHYVFMQNHACLASILLEKPMGASELCASNFFEPPLSSGGQSFLCQEFCFRSPYLMETSASSTLLLGM
jgi:hypothetical protein